MKTPHLVRVEEEPEAFAALAEAVGAAGLRLGWLEWRAPEPLPASLTAAAGLGALRAVAVGGGLSAAVKPIGGPPVLGDLLRQHFLGCALVLIHGRGGRYGETAGLPLLAPAGEGSYRLAGPGGERVLAAAELAARLRSPRPLAGAGGSTSPRRVDVPQCGMRGFDAVIETGTTPASTATAASAGSAAGSGPARYFVPGPSWVREEVLQAMTAHPLPHRGAEFKARYASVAGRLPALFRTAGDVMVASGSGTLAMQAAVASTVQRDVLHLTNGAFSERWHAISVSLGKEADRVAAPWGEPVEPDLVRRALRRKRYEAVAFAHSETSTGVLNPAAEIARMVREESDALVLADAVSSLGGAPVETDAWEVDLVLTSTQKALALPPGLALFTLSERAAERAAAVSGRGWYTDLLRYRDDHRVGGTTITTPCEPVVFALDVQLQAIEAEGVEVRWERHRRMAATAQAWAAERGLGLAAAQGFRSPTVTCLRPPEGLAAPELVRRAKARGWTVGGGYGAWKESTFRIGHMGDIGPDDLAALLEVLDEVLEEGS